MSKTIVTIIIIIIVAGLGYWVYQSTITPEEVRNFHECVAKGYPILEFYPRQCKTPDNRTFTEIIPPPIEPVPPGPDTEVFTQPPEPEEGFCAEDGEVFSTVLDKYPGRCCEGLKEWLPIPDTRFSIADVCYELGPPSESQIGICIKCGDGICENHLMYNENPCNCPEDCAGKNKSHFSSIEEFCQSSDWKISLSKACEGETFKGFPICGLCTF